MKNIETLLQRSDSHYDDYLSRTDFNRNVVRISSMPKDSCFLVALLWVAPDWFGLAVILKHFTDSLR